MIKTLPPVNAQSTDPFSNCVVIREKCSAISETRKCLCWKKTRGTNVRGRATRQLVLRRPKTLCSIFDNRNLMGCRQYIQLFIVRHLTIEIDGDNGFCSRRHCTIKGGRIDVKRVTLNIDKNRCGSNKTDNLCRCHKRKRGRNNFVAWPNVESSKCQLKT